MKLPFPFTVPFTVSTVIFGKKAQVKILQNEPWYTCTCMSQRQAGSCTCMYAMGSKPESPIEIFVLEGNKAWEQYYDGAFTDLMKSPGEFIKPEKYLVKSGIPWHCCTIYSLWKPEKKTLSGIVSLHCLT